MKLFTKLNSPDPGWCTNADVVVVGSGIAGLTTALKLRQKVGKVLLITKTVLSSGSTLWAQGGIAAALSDTDSPQAHFKDTMVAGAGLCDETAVQILVNEGPQRVRELVALGAKFDTDSNGEISLTREGGHHADRIAHAGGDATGAEISRALVAALEAVRDDPGIEVMEHCLVLDILTTQNSTGTSQVAGVNVHVIGEGTRNGVGAVLAPVVVLATGGIGQIYNSTTNPKESTGDGMAAALRAGAVLADLEFVQFHPTVLWLGSTAVGQQPLISEAVRGEGAWLVDVTGSRFMLGQHELAELAPRDVVAKAIVRQMAATGADHVYLDARHLGAQFLQQRFPTIVEQLARHGFNMAEDLLPVAPAQHYHSGGILVDADGCSTLPGLYAVGEVSCTGVHGANRLASNSLLEGLVFANRIADHVIANYNPSGSTSSASSSPGEQEASSKTTSNELLRTENAGLISAVSRSMIQHAATSGPGVIRNADALRTAAKELGELTALPATVKQGSTADWETTNLHQIACALTLSATLREESRGGHYRTDFLDQDARWLGRIQVKLDVHGNLQHKFVPLASKKE